LKKVNKYFFVSESNITAENCWYEYYKLFFTIFNWIIKELNLNYLNLWFFMIKLKLWYGNILIVIFLSFSFLITVFSKLYLLEELMPIEHKFIKIKNNLFI
jgi:hypothetical protein